MSTTLTTSRPKSKRDLHHPTFLYTRETNLRDGLKSQPPCNANQCQFSFSHPTNASDAISTCAPSAKQGSLPLAINKW